MNKLGMSKPPQKVSLSLLSGRQVTELSQYWLSLASLTRSSCPILLQCQEAQEYK